MSFKYSRYDRTLYIYIYLYICIKYSLHSFKTKESLTKKTFSVKPRMFDMFISAGRDWLSKQYYRVFTYILQQIQNSHHFDEIL